jgi:hypothetical protein
MLNFITANTFLNIIAASQDTETGYEYSGTANTVLYILAFPKYFVCGVKRGAPEWKMSDFAIFETDSQRGSPESFILIRYYSV